jgi:predicted nucleic acid-binding protein
VEKKIDALVSLAKMIEISRFVARDARDLIRTVVALPAGQSFPKGISLKPLDAMHLASAKRRGLKEFHTYDTGLYKFDGIFGMKIIRPVVPELPLALSSLPLTD